jgi:hypothetical protein
LFEAEADAELPQGDAARLMRTFLRGGMDTTIAGIGAALRLLALSPDLWSRLRGDRALAKVAFEEALRLESPIQTYYRTTRPGAQVAGIALQPDVKLQLLIGAANRDPRRWSTPDRFDLDRNPSGHIAFGYGIHVCIGQMIARLEAECLFGALLDRVERLELAGAPVYRPLNALRTLDRLPLYLRAA